MARTHIEVTAANDGAAFLGLTDGQLLRVVHESDCFITVRLANCAEFRISKQTKRYAGNLRVMINGKSCRMTNKPLFNV